MNISARVMNWRERALTIAAQVAELSQSSPRKTPLDSLGERGLDS